MSHDRNNRLFATPLTDRPNLLLVSNEEGRPRLPLMQFHEVERRLKKVRRALSKPDVIGLTRRLLREEEALLLRDLSARPFDLRTARQCEQQMRWLARRAITHGMDMTPGNDNLHALKDADPDRAMEEATI